MTHCLLWYTGSTYHTAQHCTLSTVLYVHTAQHSTVYTVLNSDDRELGRGAQVHDLDKAEEPGPSLSLYTQLLVIQYCSVYSDNRKLRKRPQVNSLHEAEEPDLSRERKSPQRNMEVPRPCPTVAFHRRSALPRCPPGLTRSTCPLPRAKLMRPEAPVGELKLKYRGVPGFVYGTMNSCRSFGGWKP